MDATERRKSRGRKPAAAGSVVRVVTQTRTLVLKHGLQGAPPVQGDDGVQLPAKRLNLAKSASKLSCAVVIVPVVKHSEIDKVSLLLARRVAERLCARPELLEVARANLSRWKQRNADSPSLLRCYSEWEAILTRPLEEICGLLVAESEQGQHLRQNSPFAGVLSPAEVWEIKNRQRHAAPSA